jgi:hypothetical protein
MALPLFQAGSSKKGPAKPAGKLKQAQAEGQVTYIPHQQDPLGIHRDGGSAEVILPISREGRD